MITVVWTCGPGSVVGTATGYGLDGPEIESRWGRYFPHLSRPVMGSTQPPAQWVPGFSWGLRAAGAWRWPSPLLVPWSWKVITVTLLPLWAVPCTEPHAYTRVHFTLPQCLYKGALYLTFLSLNLHLGRIFPY